MCDRFRKASRGVPHKGIFNRSERTALSWDERHHAKTHMINPKSRMFIPPRFD